MASRSRAIEGVNFAFDDISIAGSHFSASSARGEVKQMASQSQQPNLGDGVVAGFVARRSGYPQNWGHVSKIGFTPCPSVGLRKIAHTLRSLLMTAARSLPTETAETICANW